MRSTNCQGVAQPCRGRPTHTFLIQALPLLSSFYHQSGYILPLSNPRASAQPAESDAQVALLHQNSTPAPTFLPSALSPQHSSAHRQPAAGRTPGRQPEVGQHQCCDRNTEASGTYGWMAQRYSLNKTF